MKKKTIIGLLILGGIKLFIEIILGKAFYQTLCNINNFGCFVGWIAYESPLIILLIILGWNLYKLIEEEN